MTPRHPLPLNRLGHSPSPIPVSPDPKSTAQRQSPRVQRSPTRQPGRGTCRVWLLQPVAEALSRAPRATDRCAQMNRNFSTSVHVKSSCLPTFTVPACVRLAAPHQPDGELFLVTHSTGVFSRRRAPTTRAILRVSGPSSHVRSPHNCRSDVPKTHRCGFHFQHEQLAVRVLCASGGVGLLRPIGRSIERQGRTAPGGSLVRFTLRSKRPAA